MSAYIWAAWSEQWALEEKVSFDGMSKTITVHSDVASLSIRDDVYNAWVRWTEREPWAFPAMRFSGADPIPGGESGVTFFTINGWKLIYDANKVAINGVLFSEDYPTAYWTVDNQPIYPAVVSSLVNSAVSYQNVVTGDLSTVPTTNEIVSAVLAQLNPSVIADAILMLATQYPIHSNMVKTNSIDLKGDGSVEDKFRSVLAP
jgi:hypothetical protein